MAIVKNYMMRSLNSVSYEDTVEDAIVYMHKTEMPILPVVDEENHFIGTIYSKNILKNIIPEQYGFINSQRILYDRNQAAENLSDIKYRKVEEYMVTKTDTVLERDNMDKIADIMLNNKESYLFVTNDEGYLRGYISRGDLLYYLLCTEGECDY
ncbi:MAG TPA: CBS domain-containing protein [Halanaerobiales bacterium]|nr:CBS domain-containing protein [Halanaerobiales bacterium]